MTASEIVDHLSDTLISDERILSVPEKELLANLLRRAQTTQRNGDHAITDVITQSVGEIVAQRAYGVVGESITRRLASAFGATGQTAPSSRLMPGPGPGPGPKPGPFPPGPNPPGPHGTVPALETQTGKVAVAEMEEILPGDCVILDEFLAPAELNTLLQHVLAHEADFQSSEVVFPGVAGGMVDHDHRRSRILTQPNGHEAVVVDRIRPSWTRILSKLKHAPFVSSGVEAQITASNDGDFFRWHSDNAQEVSAPREITFVYFFHREPKSFHGGELRIYDSSWENGGYVPMNNYRTVVPQQNQIVLFASSLAHEITPVVCSSRAFADSRFTVNGWFHK